MYKIQVDFIQNTTAPKGNGSDKNYFNSNHVLFFLIAMGQSKWRTSFYSHKLYNCTLIVSSTLPAASILHLFDVKVSPFKIMGQHFLTYLYFFMLLQKLFLYLFKKFFEIQLIYNVRSRCTMKCMYIFFSYILFYNRLFL